MYDDLVKRLRKEAGEWCANCCYKCGDNVCGSPDDRKKDCDIYTKLQAADAIEELSKPRWIPVTERKPKTDDIVIVAIHDDSGDTPYDVTDVGFYLDVFPLGIWVVENERCNYVTHWMPLPEPPNEG